MLLWCSYDCTNMRVQRGFEDELEYDWLYKWWWFYVGMQVLDIREFRKYDWCKFWYNCITGWVWELWTFSQVQENLGFSQKLMHSLMVHVCHQVIARSNNPLGLGVLATSWISIGVHSKSWKWYDVKCVELCSGVANVCNYEHVITLHLNWLSFWNKKD